MKKKKTRDIDTLALMLKRGDICRIDFEAGRRFQEEFCDAGFGGAKGVSYDRKGSGTPPASPVELAVMRGESVAEAIDRMGGTASPCGSAAWNVLGVGMSLSDWAALQGCRREEAKGMLLGCLSILSRHYGYA